MNNFFAIPIHYKKRYGRIYSKPSRESNTLNVLASIDFSDIDFIISFFENYSISNKFKKNICLKFFIKSTKNNVDFFDSIKFKKNILSKSFFFKIEVVFLQSCEIVLITNDLLKIDLLIAIGNDIETIELVLEAKASGCKIVCNDSELVRWNIEQDLHIAKYGNAESIAKQIASTLEDITADDWWQLNGGYSTYTAQTAIAFSQFSASNNIAKISITANDQKFKKKGLFKLAQEEYRQIKRPCGINAVGFFNVSLGLGESARAIVHGLREQTLLPYSLVDFRLPHQTLQRTETTFSNFEEDFKYSINLSMVNSPELPHLISKYTKEKFEGRYNIGIWYWELVDLNQDWYDGLKLIDELWVTSDYIKDNLIQVSPIPVHKITLPIIIEKNKIYYSREKFVLPKNIFLFIFAFDHNSLIARKNPYAVIDAYRLAFGSRKDVGLVIKTLNGDNHCESETALRHACIDLNVFFIEVDLDRDDTLSLYNTCNCFVSLHRAEGFGMSLAEAMFMGKPVIATGYSGNMEFMNYENSLPVRYELVQINEDHGPYKKGQWWADPDIIHASHCMTQLHENEDLCTVIGQNAQTHITLQFSAIKCAETITNRITDIMQNSNFVDTFCKRNAPNII